MRRKVFTCANYERLEWLRKFPPEPDLCEKWIFGMWGVTWLARSIWVIWDLCTFCHAKRHSFASHGLWIIQPAAHVRTYTCTQEKRFIPPKRRKKGTHSIPALAQTVNVHIVSNKPWLYTSRMTMILQIQEMVGHTCEDWLQWLFNFGQLRQT